MSDLDYLLRILLAAGLSAAIGIERELHGRPAGLRTHMLVGAGAALIVVGFQAAWSAIVGEGPLVASSAEVARLAAGVITGIGFLGAGTILKHGDWVLGLTTAASLWFVAALGVAAGLGVFWIAAGSTAIGVAILSFVDPLTARIPSAVYPRMTLVVDGPRQRDVEEAFQACCAGRRMRVTLVEWEWDSAKGLVTMIFRLRHRGRPDLQGLAEQAAAIEGVRETQVRL